MYDSYYNNDKLLTGDNKAYYLSDDEKEIIIHGIKNGKTCQACWWAVWSDEYLKKHPIPRDNFKLYYEEQHILLNTNYPINY